MRRGGRCVGRQSAVLGDCDRAAKAAIELDRAGDVIAPTVEEVTATIARGR